MRILQYIFLSIIFVVLPFQASARIQNIDEPLCEGQEECLDDPHCLCYCSGICEPREKKPDDRPVYIKDDPRGHYCYCNQWDIDVYEQHGCAIKESYGR